MAFNFSITVTNMDSNNDIAHLLDELMNQADHYRHKQGNYVDEPKCIGDWYIESYITHSDFDQTSADTRIENKKTGQYFVLPDNGNYHALSCMRENGKKFNCHTSNGVICY